MTTSTANLAEGNSFNPSSTSSNLLSEDYHLLKKADNLILKLDCTSRQLVNSVCCRQQQPYHHRSRRKENGQQVECYGQQRGEKELQEGQQQLSEFSAGGCNAHSTTREAPKNIRCDAEHNVNRQHSPPNKLGAECEPVEKRACFTANGSTINNNQSDDHNPYFFDSDDEENNNIANLLPTREHFQLRSKFNYLLNLYKYLLNAALILLIISEHANSFIINVAEYRQPQQQQQQQKYFHGVQGTNETTRHLFKRTTIGDSDGISIQHTHSQLRALSSHAKLQLEVDALAYLQRYGYMNGSSLQAGNANNLISEESFNEAVMSFQRFAGIPETGSIDSLTVKFMQMPRCGNKDHSGKGENGRRRRRRKRYALQGSKWRRQELTYRISQYPARFSHKKHEVDGQIERAFKIWSQVSPIDFVVKKEGRVHIDIRFTSGEHGDGDPFDGPGNTLAHAYFPQYGGDAHFDDQEYWTVDSYAGTNIFQVAAHELGHSLGLGHSSVREALMAPFYQKYKPNFKLHADDVLAIQALYGERTDDHDSSQPGSGTTSTSTTTTTTTTESSNRRSNGEDEGNDNGGSGGGFFGFGSGSGSGSGQKPADLCQDSAIDAITRTEDGNTYVFRGQYYWQIKNEGLASGFPAKISRDWQGLPGNLDSALTWSDGKTFFFKGDKYWRFFNKRREPGYPKLISSGFAGIPNYVDAAFVWGGNGKTYFFKKDKYWRFDSKQEPPVSSQYPKSIKNWSGLPTSGIDGAFKWENGMTYFFKDDQYYRFDDRQFEVDTSAKPSFPRSTAEWWFGCTNSNLPIRRRQENSADDELADQQQDQSSSSLVYHRKPNLILDGANEGLYTNTRIKPAGNSISRSIFSGLSSLFPSSSSSSPPDESSSSSVSSSNSGASLFDDWSFHRGIGEELRHLKVGARSAGSDHSARRPTQDSRARANIIPDVTRWNFPISGSPSSSREQSMSELRMAPTDSSGGETSDDSASAAAAR